MGYGANKRSLITKEHIRRRIKRNRFLHSRLVLFNEPPSAAVEAQEETKAETASQTDQEMLLKLLANPEMAALLKSLAKNL